MQSPDAVPDGPSPNGGANAPLDGDGAAMPPIPGPGETARLDGDGGDPAGPPAAPPGPVVGRAHVRGGPGGLDATAGWVGATTRVQLTVTDADTAQAVGSGDVPVLGTPRVLALMEAATVGATANRVPPGATTVGTRVELEHRVATPVGRTVVAEARLAKVDGRRLTFEVTVRDGDNVVAEGRIERVVVDRRTFVQRAFGQS